jgi:putative transposase
VVPFFAHPPEIRKVIYTTNAIESLKMSLRNIAKRWTMPVHDWKAALNRFALVYENRLPVN